MPDPGEIKRLETDGDWARLAALYRDHEHELDPVLGRCLEVARSCGAVSCIIETRYIDLDYRSEFAAFYSGTFADVEDSAHRVHFFRSPASTLNLANLAPKLRYVGYIVIRPLEFARVGRTMLPPPPKLRRWVRTTVTDEVNLFGSTYSVTGVPFMAQDRQLDRCAHIAEWVCHYSAYLRGEVARSSIADFAVQADPALSVGRDLPSAGLNVQQLLDLGRKVNLPSVYYQAGKFLSPSMRIDDVPDWLPPDPEPPEAESGPAGSWDWRFIPTACRYLNSRLPVIITSRHHAFVLCGWHRKRRRNAPDWITLIRHDDERGPYQTVGDIFQDEYSPWESALVPMPRKLFLLPEAAEIRAATLIESWLATFDAQAPEAGANKIIDLVNRKRLALRTYATTSNRFKAGLSNRGMPSELVAAYRLARFPRYIWVVEAVSRDARAETTSCVLGEVIIDPTSPDRSPTELAVHLGGFAWLSHTDGRDDFSRCSQAAYRTGGYGPS